MACELAHRAPRPYKLIEWIFGRLSMVPNDHDGPLFQRRGLMCNRILEQYRDFVVFLGLTFGVIIILVVAG